MYIGSTDSRGINHLANEIIDNCTDEGVGGHFGGSGYKTSGGLHGVGASAVNALALRFDVTVKRDGKVHEISFQRGVPGAFDGPGPDAPFTREPGLRVSRRMKRGEPSGTS